MRPLLVLRPEPGASATVKRARELGLEPVAAPLFEIEPLPWEAPEPGGFDALLLTSANAVRHGGSKLAKLRGLRVYAVGDATAEAARESGFDIVCDIPRKAPSALTRRDLAPRFQDIGADDLTTSGAFVQSVKPAL